MLFIDIVGYSNLFITEQHDHVAQLNRLVRASHCFRTAEATGELLCLPTAMGWIKRIEDAEAKADPSHGIVTFRDLKFLR